MPSIEDQLRLERSMIERGAHSFNAQNNAQSEAGRGSETTYGRRLIKEYMQSLTEDLQEFLVSKSAGNNAKIKPYLRMVQADKAMFIALKALFNSFTRDVPVVSLASTIGTKIEDEARFSRFEEAHREYYKKVLADFKRKGTQDYRFKHRVLTHSANEHKDQWISWARDERIKIGMKLLDIICVGTDLVQRYQPRGSGKKAGQLMLSPTQAAEDWIKKHNEFHSLLSPTYLPTILPPTEWVKWDEGGYYSPEVRSTLKIAAIRCKTGRKLVAQTDMPKVYAAINTLQQTRWQVNHSVLDVIKQAWDNNLNIGMPNSDPLEVPESPVAGTAKEEMTEEQIEIFNEWKREASSIYTMERERRGKAFQVSRVIRLANEFRKYENFWYVWYLDFRGRMYTSTAGFSPQGPDVAKGTLRFAEAKPLGDRGVYWLKVHGANRFGYDKVSYDERAQWVDANRDAFIAAANDPLSHRDVWANADKPWQFLAFLQEYAGAVVNGPGFASQLPIGLDGSCNGLQNFSAMLRDEVGGRATNLIPGDKPADIYAEVARVCTAKIRQIYASGGDAPHLAAQWLQLIEKYGRNGVLPRDFAKRPVMTLPYGATRQSCTRYIFQSIIDREQGFFDNDFAAACWLTPLLWESIGEVVVAATNAMQWLQDTAGAIGKTNEPTIWSTHDGFPVYMGERKVTTSRIRTQLMGDFWARVGTFSDDIDTRRQRLGISPNFVHSQDAAHLRETVRLAAARGITSLACIHDDYGTHACDTDILHTCIRDAFVSMYTEHDPLQALHDAYADRIKKIPALPTRGSLDISAVSQSRYFFG